MRLRTPHVKVIETELKALQNSSVTEETNIHSAGLAAGPDRAPTI